LLSELLNVKPKVLLKINQQSSNMLIANNSIKIETACFIIIVNVLSFKPAGLYPPPAPAPK
jgi:hypothetical protein